MIAVNCAGGVDGDSAGGSSEKEESAGELCAPLLQTE